MLDALAYDFVRHAVIAGLLASVLCGVLGTFVVVKRLVFLAGGISHAAFGGLGLCYWLGAEPLLGAGAVALATAGLLGAGGLERGRSPDATIGVLWAVGMAVGAALIHQVPGYAPNLMTYLFGNILTVDPLDVTLTLVLVLVVLALLALYFKEFVAVAFDEKFAAVQGVPVRRVLTLLLVLVALSVVFLIRLVGIVLVIALLTIPPLIGLRLAKSLVPVMVVATLAGAAMTLGGLALSYRFDLPSGPAIVLLGTAGLLAVEAAARLARRQPASAPQATR